MIMIVIRASLIPGYAGADAVEISADKPTVCLRDNIRFSACIPTLSAVFAYCEQKPPFFPFFIP